MNALLVASTHWLVLGFGLVLGLLIGQLVFKPVSQPFDAVKKEKEESFQVEKIHDPETRTLKRVSVQKEPGMSKTVIPGKVKRIQDIDLQPHSGGPPINLEVVTSEGAEGTRVTVQSSGADVIYGQDVVIPQKIMTIKNLHWNTQILARFTPKGKDYGLSVGYDRNRLMTSVGVFPSEREFFVGIGVKW